MKTSKAQRTDWKLEIQPFGKDIVTESCRCEGIERRFPDYLLSGDPKQKGHEQKSGHAIPPEGNQLSIGKKGDENQNYPGPEHAAE